MQKLAAFGVALLILTAHPRALTEQPRLSAIYDAILRAHFDQASSQAASACPPAPTGACLVLKAVSIWWQIQLDPDSRALDATLEAACHEAIEATARWTEREPQQAEAWFYFAGAHAPLVQWRLLRGRRLAAAREARTIKDALERAVALDPTLYDARFGIGLYRYYAAVAPAPLRAVRWLLLMPGGDKAGGLRDMTTARERGVLVGGDADYQLHFLYLWYEREPARALELLQHLNARYPSNPLFLQRVAEVQRDYLRDDRASLSTWQTLLDRALSTPGALSAMSAARARMGIAETLVASAEYRGALDALAPVIEARPTAPYGVLARAHFTAGRAYEHIGDRSRSIAAMNAAIATAPRDDPRETRANARAALSRLRRSRD